MATEKTSLLHNNFSKEPVVVVTMPKQLLDIDEQSWSGVSRDELQAYVNDPYWVNLRRVLMIAFWVSLFAMFSASIGIASVEHNLLCTPKLKVLTMPGVTNGQQPFEIVNKLAINEEKMDKLNLTNGLGRNKHRNGFPLNDSSNISSCLSSVIFCDFLLIFLCAVCLVHIRQVFYLSIQEPE